jgi:hypothetical protein
MSASAGVERGNLGSFHRGRKRHALGAAMNELNQFVKIGLLLSLLLPLPQHWQADGALDRHDFDHDYQSPQAELKPAAISSRRLSIRRLGFHRPIIPHRRQPEQGILTLAATEPKLRETGRERRLQQRSLREANCSRHLSNARGQDFGKVHRHYSHVAGSSCAKPWNRMNSVLR